MVDNQSDTKTNCRTKRVVMVRSRWVERANRTILTIAIICLCTACASSPSTDQSESGPPDILGTDEPIPPSETPSPLTVTPTSTSTPLPPTLTPYPTAAPSPTPYAQLPTLAVNALKSCGDLDTGSYTCDDSADYQLSKRTMLNEGEQFFNPANGAVFAIWGDEEPALSDCSRAPLNADPRLTLDWYVNSDGIVVFEPTDFQVGMFVCYKTNLGQYGFFHIGIPSHNPNGMRIAYFNFGS